METLKNQILEELEVAHNKNTNHWTGTVSDILKEYFCSTISKNGELSHIIEYPLEALSSEQQEILERGINIRLNMEENKIELLNSDNLWIG